MERKIYMIIICFALLLGGIDCGKIEAQSTSVEGVYKNAKMRFIVPYGAGTYDLWARMLVPFLEKQTGARILVENMEGAGGLMGGGHLYALAKPDGFTIGLMPATGMVLAEMLGFGAAKFDMNKFSYIGRVAVEHRGVFASKPSGFRSIVDMQKSNKIVRFGTPDISAHSTVNAALLIEAFGLNAKIIPGYKGSKEFMLAVTAGRELDAVDTVIGGYEGEVRSGALALVAISGKERHPDFPEIPTVLETPGLKPEGKKYIDLINTLHDLNRMILGPPGLPEDRRLFLEKAVSASLKEPAMMEWARKNGFNISHLDGNGCKELIARIMQIVPIEERPKIKHIITEKHF